MSWTQQEIIQNSNRLLEMFTASKWAVRKNYQEKIGEYTDYMAQMVAGCLYKERAADGEIGEISMGLAGAWSTLLDLVVSGSRGHITVDWDRCYRDLKTIVPQLEIAERQQNTLEEQTDEYWETYSAMLGKPSRRNQNRNAA